MKEYNNEIGARKMKFIFPTIKNLFIREPIEGSYVLSDPKDLSKAIAYQKIDIQYRSRNGYSKETIMDMIQYLSKLGRDVTVIEMDRLFSDEELMSLKEQNYDFKVTLRYMLTAFLSSFNLQMTYSLPEYYEVLKKVHFLVQKINENCPTDDLKIIMAANQLVHYITYYQTEETVAFLKQWKEMNNLSEKLQLAKNYEKAKYEDADFYAVFQKRKSLCLGFAIAFWKVSTELHIPCHLVLGHCKTEEGHAGHAWNRVFLNDRWYNMDVTLFANKNDLRWLLKSDKEFPNHYEDESSNISCKESYDSEKLQSLLEYCNTFPNFLAQYDEQYQTQTSRKK